MKINLNSASFDEIAGSLHRVGEFRAREIINNRPFQDWQDLRNKVPRISQGMIRDIIRSGGVLE